MGNQCTKGQADYTISVVTGDKRNAGTDSNIKIILHDENGNKSPEYTLNNRFRNDFERGEVDRSNVSLPEATCAEFRMVKKIEFWRGDSGISSEWYLDRIDVNDLRTTETFTFPVFRWVKAHHHYVIKHLDTALPQDDENKEQRQMELDDKKKVYVLTQKVDNGPVQVNALPDDERFSWDYRFERNLFLKIVDGMTGSVSEPVNPVWDITKLKMKLMKDAKITKILTGQWDNLESIKDMFNRGELTLPKGAERWQSDLYFGWQRIGSCSYDLIKLCKEIPDKFGVTDEMLKPLLEGKCIQEALDNNALYIVDLEMLVGLTTKENCVLCAPFALFYQNDKKELLPVAIQLFQEKALDNPVFLPTDPEYTWLAAKMWYNMADASYHQSLTHLGYTHLLMEGVNVSAHRNLSVSHPVFKLLAPHFLYLLAINSLGLQVLISPGGWVDKTMSIGLTGMFELIIKGLDAWRMNVDGQLPERLKERGLLEADTLENFPFRDDAVLLYGAIKRYITKYINHYYDSPEKVAGDWELQNWSSEITRPRPDGGAGLKVLAMPRPSPANLHPHLTCFEIDGSLNTMNINSQGVAGNGKFSTADDVIEVVTSIVYTCSVGHASANFPQYDEYGFTPNYPGLLQGLPPNDKTPLTEDDILKIIPGRDMSLDMAIVTKILSQRETKSLGNFEVNYIFDPPAQKIVEEFRTDLCEIGNIIRKRNETRDMPYPYLDPSLIPNAISI